MYAQHQPIISKYASRGPQELANVCRFVLATIRCSFPDAVHAYRQERATGQRNPAAFFGTKHEGLDWIERNEAYLWGEFVECGFDAERLVALFVQIPGIGLVKAGFIAQLTRGVSGCIDTHNLQRFGMAYGDVKFNKEAGPNTRARKIAKYNRVVHALGGTETLWDEWCAYVGKAQGYGSAEQVSAMHLQVIL
jgi:hypothetical protein